MRLEQWKQQNEKGVDDSVNSTGDRSRNRQSLPVRPRSADPGKIHITFVIMSFTLSV